MDPGDRSLLYADHDHLLEIAEALAPSISLWGAKVGFVMPPPRTRG